MYKVLDYYRSDVQCATTLFHISKLILSHYKSKSKLKSRYQPGILPEYSSVQQLEFPLTELVDPTETRQFLQVCSIIAYILQLVDLTGPVNKEVEDGKLSRK